MRPLLLWRTVNLTCAHMRSFFIVIIILRWQSFSLDQVLIISSFIMCKSRLDQSLIWPNVSSVISYEFYQEFPILISTEVHFERAYLKWPSNICTKFKLERVSSGPPEFDLVQVLHRATDAESYPDRNLSELSIILAEFSLDLLLSCFLAGPNFIETEVNFASVKDNANDNRNNNTNNKNNNDWKQQSILAMQFVDKIFLN